MASRASRTAAARQAPESVRAPSFVPTGRFVELPGRGTTFIREVAGPPGAPVVMLLHGLSATGGLNWAWAFEPLGRHYRVIALDHRGHGHGMRTRRFRLADCADDVAALADVLGIDQFVPVGYSMGGPIAQLVWHRHRPRVQGLVMSATARNFRGTSRSIGPWSVFPFITTTIRTTPLAARRAVMTRMFERRIPQMPEREWVMDELRRNDPAAIAEAAAALNRYSSHDWIGAVDVPTAVVVTQHDSIVAPRRQFRLAESIPRARVFPVNGDHGVCIEAPQLFVPALQSALMTATAVR